MTYGRRFSARHEESRQFFHGHTYGGNPLAAAAALASLDVFASEARLGQLPAKISRLSQHLASLSRLPHVGDVRQCGLIGGSNWWPTARRSAVRLARAARLARCEHARRHGVLLRPLGDVIVIMPPLAISLEELDRIAAAVEAGIRAAAEDSGFRDER